MDILTKRPEGMNFKEYKFIQKEQNKNMKVYLRGSVVYRTKELIKHQLTGKTIGMRTIAPSFVGNVRRDLF